MSTRHVLLTSDQARELVGPLPPTVQVEVWDGRGEPSPTVRRAGFWVPQFLVYDRLDAYLAALPALEVVQLVTAGADALVGRVPPGVVLCDARGVHGSSTSEWVVAAILACVREFPRFVRAQSEHRWDYTFTDELAGKRILVVGAGDIGENIRQRLLPFEVEVTMVARRARPDVHAVAELPDLLPRADIVAVVVPLTPESTGMIDAAFLARMADGALLVNAARGPVADTDALTAELTSGRLRAALDVTEPEPLPPDHPLWTAPGLLLTPHVAGSVHGFPRRVFGLVRQQIERWLADKPLDNVVVDGY